ncbi:uncharacterized protein LOC134329560 [Trichomycterus rosablanca]|uniref:uncharacterized protein LOC134329560 n=1 Tax=Trichomycterus rosablanca TaxID=2290929 RepID=UPI002F35D8A2
MRPLVHCSGAAMILKAKGRSYPHLLVDREGATPVSVLQLPSYCGYIVKATWRELVLMAPYDGCYIVKQNGSYVLPLLWWGRPVKVSCPMTPGSARSNPSGFCSQFGMAIKISGPTRNTEKFYIKANEEWVPLESNTCAFLVNLPPELILFIPFTASCAKNGNRTFNVLLDWNEYTLSCQSMELLPSLPMQYHHHSSFSQPIHPHSSQILPLDVTHSKIAQVPQSVQQSDHIKQTQVPQSVQVPQNVQQTQVPKPAQDPQSVKPVQDPQSVKPVQDPQFVKPAQDPQFVKPAQDPQPVRPAQDPWSVRPAQDLQPVQPAQDSQPVQPASVSQSAQPPLVSQPVPPFQSPVGHYEPMMPMMYPPYFNYPINPYMYPYYAPYYHHKHMPPISQHYPKSTSEKMSAVAQTPKQQTVQWPLPARLPPNVQPAHIPWWPQAPQLPLVPQGPQFPLVPNAAQPTQVPQTTQVPQLPLVHQLPSRFPVFPNASSKMSPSLTCTEDHLVVELPSAKMESIKVKDLKKNVWVLVTSTPASCGYSVQREGKGAVFSSPIPACHSHVVSSLRIALILKFWNLSLQRHHVLQLQCPYSPPPSTTTMSPAPCIESTSMVLKPTSPSQQSGPSGSLSNDQKPMYQPSNSRSKKPPFQQQQPLVPFKPTVMTLDLTKETKPTISLPLSSDGHKPQVQCHTQEMSVMLPPGPISDLTVQTPLGAKNNIKAVLLEEAPNHCGYIINKNQHGRIIIHLPYKSCHMDNQDGQYQIVLTYQSADGRTFEALLSCQVPSSHECSLPIEQRLPCGPSSVGATECRELGCCFSPVTSTCYYPMDECTSDRHFVFSIPATLMDPPLLPTLLVAAGNTSCTPQRVVKGLALFKIPLDGCGAHKYEVGKTVIYMLEILNKLQSLSLNYGTITRDSPFRLLVECRYLPGSVASVGYLVKSPSLGPSIQAQGVFGVQLRIAKDQQYSSYYPQYHRPLRKLLGKPLYLEVRLLNPPDPSAVLLVHYCVAYPRSAQSAWVLIYDGCPNPFDLISTHEPPQVPPEDMANHVRRFTVNTFQFLQSGKIDENPGEEEEEEEIYFMCATEVCLPSEGPCVEGCFDRIDDFPPAKSDDDAGVFINTSDM